MKPPNFELEFGRAATGSARRFAPAKELRIWLGRSVVMTSRLIRSSGRPSAATGASQSCHFRATGATGTRKRGRPLGVENGRKSVDRRRKTPRVSAFAGSEATPSPLESARELLIDPEGVRRAAIAWEFCNLGAPPEDESPLEPETNLDYVVQDYGLTWTMGASASGLSLSDGSRRIELVG